MDQAIKLMEKIRKDPVWFSEEVIKKHLWDKEREILESVRDHRETAVRSCNASGKSFTAARVAHWWLLSNPFSVVITTAPTWRQVKEILWREIKSAADPLINPGFYQSDWILETKINIHDKWYALGLATDRVDQFQGFHSTYLLVIEDEASGIREEIHEAIDGLKPTRILMLGNPLRNSGRFAQAFKDPKVNKIHISAFDTPNVKECRTIIPGLVTVEDIERYKEKYGEDSDVFRVRVLGEFPKSDSDALISVDEVEQAIQRESIEVADQQQIIGLDVARYGDDRSIFVMRTGGNAKILNKISKKDLMEISGLATIELCKYPRAIMNIDVVGIGAGVYDRLRENLEFKNRVFAINVGSKSKDSEHFKNLRAELYQNTKEWLKNGSIDKDDDWYQLANIRYQYTSLGQLQIESKEDMKKRGISSPDVADALMLTLINNKPRGNFFILDNEGESHPLTAGLLGREF